MISRRQFGHLFLGSMLLTAHKSIAAAGSVAVGNGPGNFQYIFSDSKNREYFYDFLVNVFHLFPEEEFDALLAEAAAAYPEDEGVYSSAQRGLADIKPLLGDLTHALPALKKQKSVIAEQTAQLVDGAGVRQIDGYLEIGSTGRYVDSLEEAMAIRGQRVFVAEKAPTYAIPDMVDRGQILQAGDFVGLNNYQLSLNSVVADNSLDLVTVYIGFHHCPLELRQSFFESIRSKLRPGGSLVVRDHDVHDEFMWRVVALAHDVFNMGTNETWEYNADELRKFYSLDTLDAMLADGGFSSSGYRLYQDGDPTRNALMLYSKA